MTQTDNLYQLLEAAPNFEDEISLKKWIRSNFGPDVGKFSGLRLLRRSIPQTTTAAFVEVFEDSGETVTFPSSNATVKLWQKTDQVGTDGEKNVTITYLDEDCVQKSVTVALDDTDTTTEKDVCDDFFRLIAMECEVVAADEIILGTTGGAAIHGVIGAGNWQAVFSRYTPPANHRAWLTEVKILWADSSNPCTLEILAFKDGNSLELGFANEDIIEPTTMTPMIELEEQEDCIFKIKRNADSNHDVLTLQYTILEAEVNT
jgi:hypothetical protein